MIQLFTIEGSIDQALEITSDHFGARFVSLRSFERFTEAFSAADLGMVVWPGGTLAEKNSERFGLEYDGLYNASLFPGKPDLHDVMAFCVDRGLALTVTLPTARYAGQVEVLKADLRTFLTDLYSGRYGALPEKLYFEVGNEFYSVFDGIDEVEKAAAYAEVVNSYASTALEVEAQYEDASSAVEWSVQLGRTPEATDAMLEVLSDDAIIFTDNLAHHRFNVSLASAGKGIENVSESLELWGNEAAVLGIDRPDLSLSAYNAASLSRYEAAEAFLSEPEGAGLSIDDLDLDGRSHAAFEAFYQDMLDYRPYGLEQAESLLQVFSEYQALGLVNAGTYGWDLTHAGRMSFEDTSGQSHLFAPAQVQSMMAESLTGTKVLDWYRFNDLKDDTSFSAYGFDSDDKLVIFITAPQDFSGQSNIDLSVPLDDLGSVSKAWGERLSAEIPEDWQSLFDVPVLTGIDQSSEAETYAVGVRSTFAPDQDGASLKLSFFQPNEVIRLVFSRTDEGAEEVGSWHEGSGVDLEAYGDEMQAFNSLADLEDSDVLAEDSMVLEGEGESDYTAGFLGLSGALGALLIMMLL